MSATPFNGETATAPSPQRAASDAIKVGMGGWVYENWRDSFYPPDLVQRRELEYASRQVSAIEINSTFYSVQRPAIYGKWRDETPDDFVFTVKAPRRIMNSRALAETGPQIEDFIGGIAALGRKLGPLVWQFDKSARVQKEDFETFLSLLPKQHQGFRLRHALDLRNSHLANSACLRLARRHRLATVFTDSEEHPSFADLTADFVYARLTRSHAGAGAGYEPEELDRWARTARLWAQGEDPEDLPHLVPRTATPVPREVFVFFIGGAKERNPAAAVELLRRLGEG